MIDYQQYTDYVSPLEKNMSSYPNILTPPSSLEDSPQSVYLVSSPGSNTFEYDNYEYPPIQAVQAPYIVKPNISIDPNLIKLEIKPSLRFVEQPTDRFRFRYKSEMAGTHGSLTGINSDKSRKPTYPTVELKHCTGRVTVRCSIYQSNANGQDNLPHAHRLIMKKGKEEHDDPHDIMVGPEDGYRAVFQGMGIIHTAKKNIVSELMRKKVQLKREFNARTENKIRDLTTKEQVEIKGLAESESKSINLNIVCLRFDAFIDKDGILFPICEPIFSHGINNLKSALTGDLKIVRLDHVVGEAKGNQEIFILVERVTKKNIKIRFYEVDDEDRVVWEDWGRFNDLDVHHQYAIVFKTPKYRDENIRAPVEVFIELVRPTDGARSEPRDFRYIPNKNKAGQKRPRYDYSSSSRESSNVASDEIPVFINNLQIGNNQNPNISPLSNAPSGVSEEIRKAMNNIHSDEFKKLFTENEDTFTVFYEEMDFASIATDNTWGSSNQIVAQGGEEIFDHQMARSEIAVPEMDSRMVIAESPSWEFIKIEVTKEEKLKAIKDVDELRSFIRTTHKTHVAVEMLNYYFGKDERTNALHVSICQRDNKSALLLLKMMAYYKQLHLLDKTNNNKQTPLHLAVLCFNGPIIRSLLMCKVRMSAMDNSLNTPLHLAVKSNANIEVLKMLLKNRDCEGIKEYIDMENEHGDTALLIAIDKKNIVAIQVLCDSGADVNKIHPKNGYVPLRFAIEKKHVDIVKYLLSLNYVNATIKDFQNMSPLAAAFGKEMDLEITKAVQKYMNNNNVVLDIKEEPEDDSESEMEMDEEVEVKSEFPRLSPDELEKLYEDVKEFTPQCLNTVSAILDKSESSKHLAELLQIEHLINSGIIVSDLSMSKALLIYSIETNRDSVWMIRNFLENLDEHKAVEIIDRMVQEMKTC